MNTNWVFIICFTYISGYLIIKEGFVTFLCFVAVLAAAVGQLPLEL